MSRYVQISQNEYYHIYNRGANQESIFKSDRNNIFLLNRMKEYSKKYSITVIAYCLMPNHYHFLLRQDSELPISDFMQAVFNSYSKAFNSMYHRSGTWFEGPFRRKHIPNQEYLIHLCRYIDRNPIDCARPIVSNLEDWPYSNYPECVGLRKGSMVDHNFIRDNFEDNLIYKEFVLDYDPPQKL